MTHPLLYGPTGQVLKTSGRNFDAAKGSRYTNDWVTQQGSADRAMKNDVASLRDRARDLERNDGYAESLFIELESNIIGPKGIQMKPMARKADARASGGVVNKIDGNACEKIAQAWEDYSRRGNFDVTRQFSRASFERIAIRSIARDGGFLVRIADGFSKNKYRFAVQGLEADALNPRMTDEKKNIHMAIEYDEWDEPVAYHLQKGKVKSMLWQSDNTMRVESENLLHLFMTKRINQSQGFSWLAPVMLRLRHLSKYEEAEVIAARASANKIGFFESTGDQQYTGEEDPYGNIKAPSAPGEWESLPVGVKAHLIDPSHPNANYPDFRKAILRGVCAGIYVNYNTLAKDLEGVSYSSIRQGVLSERDTWRIIQSWFIDEFETPIFERWLKMALMTGEIEGLTIRDLDRLCHAEFSGRTWNWVDPLKDVDAAAAEVALGINSRQQIARDRGKDFTKIIGENEEDVKALESAGLPTNTQPAPAQAPDAAA